MFIKIGLEFQCLEGQENNSNAYRNRARIAVFERIRVKTVSTLPGDIHLLSSCMEERYQYFWI